MREAFARSAGALALATTPDILAQNDALRPLSAAVLGLGAGGLEVAAGGCVVLGSPLGGQTSALAHREFLAATHR